MTLRRLIVILAATLALPCRCAPAQGHAHSHGVGLLNLSIDAGGFALELDMPLDSLVGFERAPRTPREEQSVRDAVAQLRAADALFAADGGARCSAGRVELASPALPPALLGTATRAPPRAPGKSEEGHADVEARYTFSCASVGALRRIDAAGLFKAFPRLKSIEAQVVGPKGQAKRRLTRSRTALDW